MGLFDIAAPLLSWIDALVLGWLPPLLRLVAWALAGAGLTMVCYWKVSSQEEIARAGKDAARARRELAQVDGEMGEALVYVRRSLSASLRQARWMIWPAFWASLPLLFLLPWLDASYGHFLPPAAGEIAVRAYPEPALLRAQTGEEPDPRAVGKTIVWPGRASKTLILDSRGRPLAELPLMRPIPVIEKRRWWHLLFGSPIGYLPAEGTVELLEIDLPRHAYLGFGPDWMRSWEAPFFFVLVLAAGVMRFVFRIS
jgi:hypothetical protein